MEYSISQVSRLAGVTQRTLRYYDKMGLLTPSAKTAAGYRIYTEVDLEKLQQILFFRELNFSLTKIKEMISNPNYNRKDALQMQAELLEKKAQRYLKLVQLAKNTLSNIKGGQEMNKEDLFNGFNYEKMIAEQKQYEAEVKERWGNSNAYKISQERTAKLTKKDWEHLNARQMQNLKELCDLYHTDVPPEDPKAQAVVQKQHEFIHNTFYPCSLEMFSCLGNMYIADARFTAYYEKFAPGLAVYYNKAIQFYCHKRV